VFSDALRGRPRRPSRSALQGGRNPATCHSEDRVLWSFPGAWGSREAGLQVQVGIPHATRREGPLHPGHHDRERASRELGAPGKVEHVGHPCGVTPQARRRGLGSGGAQVARVVQRNQGEITCLGLKDVDRARVLPDAPERGFPGAWSSREGGARRSPLRRDTPGKAPRTGLRRRAGGTCRSTKPR